MAAIVFDPRDVTTMSDLLATVKADSTGAWRYNASLAEGGHLTHGMPLNMSGKWFQVVSYGLNAKEEIDYDAMDHDRWLERETDRYMRGFTDSDELEDECDENIGEEANID